MLVHRPLRTVLPTSHCVFGPTLAAALLLLSACASDGPSRPSAASESPLKADAAAAAAVTPVCGSTTQPSCDPPPPPPPEVIPTDTKRTPLPYGWHMPSATRRFGDPGVSWRTAGDIVRASEASSMVMSAAPVPAAFRPEQQPATLSGLLAAPSEQEALAPTTQTVALVAPSSKGSSISALIEPTPSVSIAAPVNAQSKEISVPADTARATEALGAYAAMATSLTSSKAPAAVAAPSAKPATPAEIIAAAAPPADATVVEETLDRPEWIINVATFSSPEDAKRHVDQLTAAGFKATARQETVRGRASYRVVIESLATEAAAQSALADLSTRHGFVSAWSMRKR